ncbi:3-hydroxylacyl-ACP dehydratase [Paludibacterium yongneupense]|uniref:3-hydroxylacyl-ACP dehydratase n=1 Tax=Paludibacterium yongneupense TaxID=400061 RepID=UPI0004154423|nr:3-hydroxylacyl-ACP dehydratase [Paludibacterium yongneupense]
MMPDRDWIARHIPHRGSMCLLERVLEWGPEHIRCQAHSHHAPDNPLRAGGVLAAVCAVEYAAQAMAVHGALVSGQEEAPAIGYLASVRSVELHVERLDTVPTELEVCAWHVSGDGGRVLYDFAVQGAGRKLVEGRAAVILKVAMS